MLSQADLIQDPDAAPRPQPAAPPQPSDLAFVRDKTNGAPDFTDAQLTTLIGQWTTTSDPDADADDPTPVAVYDLWAAAAMVLEQRLLRALDLPATGTQQARSGDAHLQFSSTGGSTWLLRTFIKRYWRLADPVNRALMHPSGWRTLDVGRARRYQLGHRFGGSLLVNGPYSGVDADNRDGG